MEELVGELKKVDEGLEVFEHEVAMTVADLESSLADKEGLAFAKNLLLKVRFHR